MRYEHTPRPLTESHYHIRHLIETQEAKAADRGYHREKEKNVQDRNDHIKASPAFVVMEFYCTECEKDFKAQTIKEVEVDWSNTTQYIAFYRTKCFCGKWCQRLITDKHRDSYWFKSKAVARDRGRAYADTLQPQDSGFQLLYGRKNTQ